VGECCYCFLRGWLVPLLLFERWLVLLLFFVMEHFIEGLVGLAFGGTGYGLAV